MLGFNVYTESCLICNEQKHIVSERTDGSYRLCKGCGVYSWHKGYTTGTTWGDNVIEDYGYEDNEDNEDNEEHEDEYHYLRGSWQGPRY